MIFNLKILHNNLSIFPWLKKCCIIHLIKTSLVVNTVSVSQINPVFVTALPCFALNAIVLMPVKYKNRQLKKIVKKIKRENNL
jgi:hypothetical protein